MRNNGTNFSSLHEQFQQHRHLTLQLAWEEYRQVHPDGYGYREENKARFHEKSYNAARYPGKPASRNEIQRRLEDDFEAELERTRGAQRKHAGAQPNQVRTISAGSAIQSSRRSIQDAAQRLAWRVKVLPIEEIVDANLRLDGQPFPSMGRLDLPPKLQVKRKHVAETFLTRWRSRNRRGDCAERDQLRLRKEPCVYQRLPCGSQLACAARIPLIDQRCKSTDADTPTERADRCAPDNVAARMPSVACNKKGQSGDLPPAKTIRSCCTRDWKATRVHSANR